MKRLLSILFTLLFSINLAAQSAEEAVNLLEDQDGFGIRAAGLGNAFTGVADDYSAIYWNPAGLAQIKMNEVYVSLHNFNTRDKVNYLGTATSGSRSFTKFNSFGFAYPFPVKRGSLVLALGYQRINDLDGYTEFTGYLPDGVSNNLGFNIKNELGDFGLLEFDRDFQQKQAISNEGQMSQWSIGAAIDLSSRFSAGLTLTLHRGRSEYALDYSQDDINTKNSYDILDQNGNVTEQFFYNYYDFHQKVSSDYSGFEAKFGGLIRLNEQLRLGGAITFPMTLNVDEDWSYSDELSYDIIKNQINYQYTETTIDESGVFDYNIKVPFQFSAGASYQTQLFLISGTIEYNDWSQLKYEMPEDRDPLDYEDLLAQNKIFREDFRPVLSYALGGEVNLFNSLLSLRGGYRYAPSPLKDADKKYDKQYFSAGLGFRIDQSSVVEASYTLGLWEKDKAYYYDWDADPMRVSEKYTTTRFMIGARLQF